MKKVAFFLFATLVLLMIVGSFATPMQAQELRTVPIPAGEENKFGGVYCFDNADSPNVNSLYQVVGQSWRRVLATSKNDKLRLPLNGKPRESFRDSTTYYAIARKECLYIPAPIRAKVDMFAFVETDESKMIGVNPPVSKATTNTLTPSRWTWSAADFITIYLLGLYVVYRFFVSRRNRKQEERERQKADVECSEKLKKIVAERKAERQRNLDYNNPILSGPPMVEGALNFITETDEDKPITLSPIVLAEPGDMAKHGEPEYDPSHDLIAAIAGRKEPVLKFTEGYPSRSRVFFSGR